MYCYFLSLFFYHAYMGIGSLIFFYEISSQLLIKLIAWNSRLISTNYFSCHLHSFYMPPSFHNKPYLWITFPNIRYFEYLCLKMNFFSQIYMAFEKIPWDKHNRDKICTLLIYYGIVYRNAACKFDICSYHIIFLV